MEDSPIADSQPPHQTVSNRQTDTESSPRHRRSLIWVLVLISVSLAVAIIIANQNDNTNLSGIDVSRLPRGAQAGQPAPALSFSLFDGTRFNLQEHFEKEGRPLVLNMWASWCGPCRVEIPALSEASANNPQVAFVGVAVQDSYENAQNFAEEINALYPLGIEEQPLVGDVLSFFGLPTTYLFGANGTILRQIQGEVTLPLLQAYIDHDL